MGAETSYSRSEGFRINGTRFNEIAVTKSKILAKGDGLLRLPLSFIHSVFLGRVARLLSKRDLAISIAIMIPALFASLGIPALGSPFAVITTGFFLACLSFGSLVIVFYGLGVHFVMRIKTNLGDFVIEGKKEFLVDLKAAIEKALLNEE